MPRPAPLAIDVTAALVGNTGVMRYAVAMPDALEALGADIRRFAVGRTARAPIAGVRHAKVPLRVMRQVWRTGHPRAEALVGSRISLVHSLDLQPPPSRAPRLLTVHDLGALERPDLHSPETVAGSASQLEAARGADLVCAISEATRQQLIRRGLAPGSVVVTPSALPDIPMVAGPSVREPGYILMVGMVTPRKGFDVMVRAMEHLPSERLIIVGPDGYRAEETVQLIERSPARDRIERPGFVDDATLAVLLRDAGCQVVPSRIEGFGLPPLEAMARRVPVVCSDLPAIREVAGETPFFVPVDDPEALAECVLRALAEPRDGARIEAGPAEAARHSWERAARAVAVAYESVLQRSVLPG